MTKSQDEGFKKTLRRMLSTPPKPFSVVKKKPRAKKRTAARKG